MRELSSLYSARLDELGGAYSWLNHARNLLNCENLDVNDSISWSALNAIRQKTVALHAISSSMLLPLFREHAHTPSMIYHGMNVLKAVTNLNPGQIPVMVVDQPLFTLAKKIQWRHPNTHGEDKYVVMLGVMHTEMILFDILGDWLAGSGWICAITNSGISTSGVADSFILITNLAKPRWIHQVIALALYVCLHRAYDEYVLNIDLIDEVLDIDKWIILQNESQPQFNYWYQILQFELLALQYVHSIRMGDFSTYLATIEHLIPWVFALDHLNYACNLPINLRDMYNLKQLHPLIYEFNSGRFVAHKSKHAFSAIALDQNLEQLIGDVKGKGGAIGLTERILEDGW
jgi:hypothetical protein